jgi:hypothetical protein
MGAEEMYLTDVTLNPPVFLNSDQAMVLEIRTTTDQVEADVKG